LRLRFRKYILPDFANADIEVKFILARPNLWKLNPADRLAKRAELKRKVKAEIDEFDDIIVLPVSVFAGEGEPDGRI
jgi:hypothetical protein